MPPQAPTDKVRLPRNNGYVNKSDRVQRATRASETVLGRLRCVRRIESLMAAAREKGKRASVRKAHAELLDREARGMCLGFKVPKSKSTVARWIRATRGLQASDALAALADNPRSGRKPEAVDANTYVLVRDAWVVEGIATFAEVHRHVNRKIKAKARSQGGRQPDPISMHKVRRVIVKIGRAARALSKQGRKAAELDGTAVWSRPASRPHEVWAYDELVADVWLRFMDPETHELRATKAWIILVVDLYSGLIIGFRLVRPYSGEKEMSFTANDVVSALLTCAVPELAIRGNEGVVGVLPEIVICDNDSKHREAASNLERAGVTCNFIERGKPWRNGKGESAVKALKGRLLAILGHGSRYIPASRVKATPDGPQVPKMNEGPNAPEARRGRRLVIPDGDLLGFKDFEEILTELISELNSERKSWLEDRTPLQVVVEDTPHPDGPRFTERCAVSHEALVLTLPVQSYMVDREIRVRDVRYTAIVDGRQLPPDKAVPVRVEPKGRCIWIVDAGGRLWYQKTLRDASDERDAGEGELDRNREIMALEEQLKQYELEFTEREFGEEAAERIVRANEAVRSTEGSVRRRKDSKEARAARKRKASRASRPERDLLPEQAKPDPGEPLPDPQHPAPKRRSGPSFRPSTPTSVLKPESSRFRPAAAADQSKSTPRFRKTTK